MWNRCFIKLAACGLPRLSPLSRITPASIAKPKEHSMADKKADLAGPGIGDYLELEKVLPTDYSSLLSPKETQKALFEVNATSKTISVRN